jgi:predicted ester cyclase
VRLEVTIEDLIAGPDRVAVRLHWRGSRASGEAVDRQTLEVVRIEKGKAVGHWGAGVEDQPSARPGVAATR